VICLACGYDVGRDTGTCPECGIDVGSMKGAHAARARIDVGREGRRHALAWVVVLVVYALGAGVVGRSIWWVPYALVAMGAALTGSLVLAIPGTLAAPPWFRPHLLLAWVRGMWWMHAAWLAISFCAVIIACVGFVDRWSDLNGELVVWVALAGLALWALACFIFLFKAFERVFVSIAPVWPDWLRRPRRELVSLLLGLAILVVMLGAALLGLVGGAFAVDGALEIVDPDLWKF